jgi:ElaB/YqjD/DUF883 family membrane-anchored ribosome-binding protein
MSEYERQNPGLAYEPTGQNFGSDAESRTEKSPEEIEREIEETRNRMSQNIDELGDRLSPDHLKNEAKEKIRNAAQGAVTNVGEQARRTGNRLVDVIRENPLPVIAVGAGVTWLLRQRSNSDVSGNRMARYSYTGPDRRQYEGGQYEGRYREGRQYEGNLYRGGEFEGGESGRGMRDRVGGAVSGAKEKMSEKASGIAEKAGELASGTQERIGELGERARRQTDRVRTNLEHVSQENPLVVAIGATVIGLALGLLLPGTERENELMGTTRDELVDRAQNTAERVKDAAAEAGREVKEAVKNEVSEIAPEMKHVVQDASSSVKEQVKESAKKVKQEAQSAAKEPGNNPRSKA